MSFDLSQETLRLLLIAATHRNTDALHALLRDHAPDFPLSSILDEPLISGSQLFQQRGHFLGEFWYGTRKARVFDARWAQGRLLCSFGSQATMIFRQYNTSSPDGFDDYLWRHSDMGIWLNDQTMQEEGAFYVFDNGDNLLDHAPNTLGLTAVDHEGQTDSGG